MLLIICMIGLLSMYVLNKRFSQMNSRLANNLRHQSWFNKPLFVGGLLFITNAGLFFATWGVLFFLTKLMIPYVHLLVMLTAVLASFYSWTVFRESWHGTRGGQVLMGVIGSTFYGLFTCYFFYLFISVPETMPDNDPFMVAIGYIFGILVTGVAWGMCLQMTALKKTNVLTQMEEKNEQLT